MVMVLDKVADVSAYLRLLGFWWVELLYFHTVFLFSFNFKRLLSVFILKNIFTISVSVSVYAAQGSVGLIWHWVDVLQALILHIDVCLQHLISGVKWLFYKNKHYTFSYLPIIGNNQLFRYNANFYGPRAIECSKSDLEWNGITIYVICMVHLIEPTPVMHTMGFIQLISNVYNPSKDFLFFFTN